MKSESSTSLPAGSEGSSVGSGAAEATDGQRARSRGIAEPPPRPIAPSPAPRPTPRTAPSAVSASPLTLDFALLRGALEELPFGVATTRGDTIHYANEALCRIFGVPHGSLENRPIAQLFSDEAFAEIAECLAAARVFDGRVAARSESGRPIEVELHVEWYSSEAQGVGGFLVVRDVSLEHGALGRLVEQIGGALFRVRTADTVVELVSPAIHKLTGVDAATAKQRPVVLTALVSAEERERVAFLYRRLARGEMAVASAQVSLRRPDGSVRVLQIRASGRRDCAGTVRHIEGVVSEAHAHEGGHARGRDPDAAHDPTAARATEGSLGWLTGSQRVEVEDGRDALSAATMELSHELLREGSQLVHALGRELKGIRSVLKASAATLPPETRRDLTARLESAAIAVNGVSALNRGVRRVLSAATTLGAPLSEVLESVRATLTSVVCAGERAVSIDAGDAANVIVPERVEELTAALTYLSLRAFRFAGSGTLRIAARRVEAPPEPRGRLSRGAAPSPERCHVVVEILGSAPPDLAESAVETSSDVLRSVPRPADVDVAYGAALALLSAAGGSMESDDTTFSTARSVLRLRV